MRRSAPPRYLAARSSILRRFASTLQRLMSWCLLWWLYSIYVFLNMVYRFFSSGIYRGYCQGFIWFLLGIYKGYYLWGNTYGLIMDDNGLMMVKSCGYWWLMMLNNYPWFLLDNDGWCFFSVLERRNPAHTILYRIWWSKLPHIVIFVVNDG